MAATEQAYWDLALARQRLLIRERLTRQGIEVKKKSPEITLFICFFSPDGSLIANAPTCSPETSLGK